jgi:hypothetical protein
MNPVYQFNTYYCYVPEILLKILLSPEARYPSVTPAQAGVQLKDAWIPACAGMTIIF